MKKLFFLALMAAFTTSSFAQLLTGKSAAYAKEDSPNWSYLYVQYNPVTFSPSGDLKDFGYKSATGTGLSLGFNWEKSLSSNIPLFLEFGIGGQVTLSDEKWLNNFVLVTAKVPIGVSYVFNIPNTPIDIIPTAGLDFRVHTVGQYDAFDGHHDVDVFNEDDMGEDYTWNRFQVGAHIGANVRFWKKLLLGANYQFEFNELAKDLTTSQANLTLAICF